MKASFKRLALPCVLALVASATGCYAAVSPPPPEEVEVEPVVYADEVPYGVESYPHVWYGGRWVYLVGDRWYYTAPGGWAIYPTEPAGLYRQREHWHGGAPPPYHGTQYAPPAYPGQTAPPVHPGNVAPPAHPGQTAPPAHPGNVAPPAHPPKYVAPPVYAPKPFKPAPGPYKAPEPVKPGPKSPMK